MLCFISWSWKNYYYMLLQKMQRPAVGTTQATIQWVTWAVSLGVKQPRHEADQSPPSIAKVKNQWHYTTTTTTTTTTLSPPPPPPPPPLLCLQVIKQINYSNGQNIFQNSKYIFGLYIKCTTRINTCLNLPSILNMYHPCGWFVWLLCASRLCLHLWR
jgi:hypothetical protein